MFLSPEICRICHVVTAFQLWSSDEIMSIEITKGELNGTKKIEVIMPISRKGLPSLNLKEWMA